MAPMATPIEFWLYLPQMRLGMHDIVQRAQTAEMAGFAGIAGMDHLAPPGAESSPMFEAMTANAWVAAHTQHAVASAPSSCATPSAILRCWRARR